MPAAVQQCKYTEWSKKVRTDLSNLLPGELRRNIQREPHNIFRHTLNMLLHYFVKLLIRLNMMQIWKKYKTTCLNFACTEYNLFSLVI